MQIVEPIEHAYEWLRTAACIVKKDGEPRAVACVRIHELSRRGTSILRDRTEETTAMLRGLVGDLSADAVSKDFTGRELMDATDKQYEPVGAAFGHVFRIIVV